MNRPRTFQLPGSRSGRYPADKFLRLAENSLNTGNYELAVDNSRLAVNIALSNENLDKAAKAYELWVKALFKLKAYSHIKKVCCDARSKYGNSLDLLYYEVKAAFLANVRDTAIGLAKEFIDLHRTSKNKKSNHFNSTYDKLEEIESILKEFENSCSNNKTDIKPE